MENEVIEHGGVVIELRVAGRDPAVSLELPPTAGYHSWFHIAFARDGLRVAWTNDQTDPGHMAVVALDGRVLSRTRNLPPNEEMLGDRVDAYVPRARLSEFVRRDRLGRPIGQPVALGGIGHGWAAGDGRRFVAIYPTGISAGKRAAYIECEPANGSPILPPREMPPAPGSADQFEGDYGCRPEPCTIEGESLRLLSLRIGHECTRRVHEGTEPEEWEDFDTSTDRLRIVRRAEETGDERLTERATLLCERMTLSNGVARWAWLALRTPDGWAGCETGGGFGSLFDLQVSPHETRVGQWVEGGAPEVTVRVTIADNASDAGEVSNTTDQMLYVCGLYEGAPACWGAFAVAWDHMEGDSEGVATRVGSVRPVPDGHGRVRLAESTGDGGTGGFWVQGLACRPRAPRL